MNTINSLLNNLFSDLNITDNKKNEKNIKNECCKKNHYYNEDTKEIQSLSQGEKFKQYQKLIYKRVEENKVNQSLWNSINTNNKQFKEGFSVPDLNNINSVREEYNKTLNQYKELLASISDSVTQNIDRVSENNSYLNKYIRFPTGEIYYVNKKGVAKRVENNTILDSISGKNGCPDANYVEISIPWSPSYNIPGERIPTNPPLVVGTPMKNSESCGFEGSNVYVNQMIGQPNLTYKGCYQDNFESPSMTFIGDSPTSADLTNPQGKYTFEQCQEAAIDRGYKFFALQNKNSTTGLGYCAASNRLNNSIKYGKSYKFIPLWASNTNGKPVSYAILTKNGTLSVRDINGVSYFTSPNGTNCDEDYSISEDMDAPGSDIGRYSNQTVNSCKDLCIKNNNCKGFAYNTSNNSTCWLKSSDMTNTSINYQRTLYKKLGNANDCKYFLKLQNDGNMSIYKGEPNSQNINTIWNTNTNGLQKESNDNYVYTESKYGTSFIKNDQLLNKGDWIGSEDGKIILIMQEDGNLVLYTFEMNCNTIGTNGPYSGGNLSNPIYDIGSKGFKNKMGSIGFIDSDSKFHNYKKSNIKYSNNYSSILENTIITGSDITGASFANSKNIEDCMSACNNLDECSGFVYDTTGQTPVCQPKNTTKYYNSKNMQSKIGADTYVRDKSVIKPANGINNIINNINSILFNNYSKYKKNNLNFDITSLNSVQKQQLEQLESKLEQLSDQLKGYSGNLSELNLKINSDTEMKTQQFYDNIKNIGVVSNKIKQFGTKNNVDNILNETEIKTLQENYNYIFWSTIAIATVLVAINIKK
jgi:hypothetical protein